MGDHTWWEEDCPKCSLHTVEVHDAPSSLQYSRRCHDCGWTDGLSYYETEPATVELLTKEEAKKRGLNP